MNIFKGAKLAKLMLLVMFLVAAAFLSGCAAKGLSKSTQPPVFPDAKAELPAGLIVDEATKTMTANMEDVTLSIEYWSTYRLNRTYNRGNTISPFYYEEAWHQGDKTDAFYLTITNKRDKPIYFKPDACSMKDDRQYYYTGLSYKDLEGKIKYKLGRDIRVNNGLEKAKEILISTQLRDGEIAPGQTAKGFVPFTKIARTAAKVLVTIVIEKSPETAIGRYQKLEFVFPFIQDPFILAAQPAVQRY